jgi:hypothetical protein
MAKLTITIETGNDAFKKNPYELRDILMRLTALDHIADGMRLLDHNGNTVGRLTIEDEEWKDVLIPNNPKPHP